MRKSLYILFILIGFSPVTQAQTAETEISDLLDEFLSKVSSKEMHDRFWSDDLIYTSATGKRFGKDSIMAGFKEDNSSQSGNNTPRYSAEDKQIRVMGETAILAFTLVSKNTDGSTESYLNSGTFSKQDGLWKVILWQATKAE